MEPTPAQRAARDRIAAEFAHVGFVMPGTLTVRAYACGKPNCRCHASPPRPHGPYPEWIRKIVGKTITGRAAWSCRWTSELRLSASVSPWDLRRLTLPGVTGDAVTGDQDAGRDDALALPEHLSTLIGALHGPEDLGRHHDKYLTCPDRDDVAGAASA